MGIRLMHLADLHLGAPLSFLGERADERARDIESAFTRALASAGEKKVDAVVICGDLFDRFNPPADLVARTRSAFERLARDNIPVILLPGTHDSHRYSRCVYLRERFPGVDILLEMGKPLRRMLNECPVHFYGYSGGRPDEAACAFRRTPEEGLHVALVHGTVAENEEWAASPRDYSLTSSDIETSGFHYVALGHHHNFREYRCGAGLAVYPGTLEGLKFGENGERCLVIAQVRETGAALERTRFNRKTLHEISIDLAMAGIECGEALTAAIRVHAAPDAIARIILTGSSDFLPAAEQIRAGLAGAFFHLQIEDQSSLYDGDLVRRMHNDRTVQGIFIRRLFAKLEAAPPEQRAALELALRLTMEQFQQVHNETERDHA